MSLKDLEPISSAIVVLPAAEGGVQVSAEDVGKIIREPVASQQPDGSLQIASLRDQALILIGGGRLQFINQSGREPQGNRLPEIVNGLVKIVSSQGIDKFRAYGLNYDAAFDSRGDLTASQTIAEAFLNTGGILSKSGIEIRGAGLQLFFNHTDAKCTLKLEPRLGDVSTPRMYAGINYTFELDAGPIPALDELKLKYHGFWVHFLETLERLLG